VRYRPWRAEAMESELSRWLARYPVPIMEALKLTGLWPKAASDLATADEERRMATSWASRSS